MCSVFWLFWLSCQYLPSDWLEIPLWGSLIVARGSSPESPGRRVLMIFLVYCIASLFYYVFVLSPAPMWYIILLLWRDIAFCAESAVKPQANKQTNLQSGTVRLNWTLYLWVLLHCALASGAVYCNRSCLCVCVFANGRWVSEPYNSQRARTVCVCLSVFFH